MTYNYSHHAGPVSITLIFVEMSLIGHIVMAVPRVLLKIWIVTHSASIYAYQDEIHGPRRSSLSGAQLKPCVNSQTTHGILKAVIYQKPLYSEHSSLSRCRPRQPLPRVASKLSRRWPSLNAHRQHESSGSRPTMVAPVSNRIQFRGRHSLTDPPLIRWIFAGPTTFPDAVLFVAGNMWDRCRKGSQIYSAPWSRFNPIVHD
jgi:hypothetical protein